MSERKPKVIRPLTKMERFQEIEALLEEGHSSNSIAGILCLKFGVTESTVHGYISEYWKALRGQTRGDLSSIISQHLYRYEQIYRDCNGIEERWNDPSPGLRTFLIAKWDNALRALQQKERLLGLHRKELKIKVRNVFQSDGVSEQIESKFAFKKLSLKQLKRVVELLEKSRENPYPGHHPLIIKQQQEARVVEESTETPVKKNLVVDPSPVKDIPLLEAPSSELSNRHVLLQEKTAEFGSPEEAVIHFRKLILQKHLSG